MGYTQNQEHSKDMMFQWHHTHQELLKLKKILFPNVSARTQLHINDSIDNADKEFKYWQEEFHKNGGLDTTIEMMNQKTK